MISFEGLNEELTESIRGLLEESEEFEDFDGYVEFTEQGRAIIDGHFDREQLAVIGQILKLIENKDN